MNAQVKVDLDNINGATLEKALKEVMKGIPSNSQVSLYKQFGTANRHVPVGDYRLIVTEDQRDGTDCQIMFDTVAECNDPNSTVDLIVIISNDRIYPNLLKNRHNNRKVKLLFVNVTPAGKVVIHDGTAPTFSSGQQQLCRVHTQMDSAKERNPATGSAPPKIEAQPRVLVPYTALNEVFNSVVEEAYKAHLPVDCASRSLFDKKLIDFIHCLLDSIKTAQYLALRNLDLKNLESFSDTRKLDAFRRSVKQTTLMTEEDLRKCLQAAQNFANRARRYCVPQEVIGALIAHEDEVRAIETAGQLDHKDQVAIDRYHRVVTAYRKAQSKGSGQPLTVDFYTVRKIIDCLARHAKKAA